MELCVPVTCILMSILDLGHPLRRGSNMGYRCTAKPGLCSAFIHLWKRKNMARIEVKKQKLTNMHVCMHINSVCLALKMKLQKPATLNTESNTRMSGFGSFSLCGLSYCCEPHTLFYRCLCGRQWKYDCWKTTPAAVFETCGLLIYWKWMETRLKGDFYFHICNLWLMKADWGVDGEGWLKQQRRERQRIPK